MSELRREEMIIARLKDVFWFPEGTLVDFLPLQAERAAVPGKKGRNVFCFHLRPPEIVIPALEHGGSNPQFLQHFAASARLCAFPRLQMTADRGVPFAGLNILVRGSLLEKQAAAIVKNRDMDRLMDQGRIAMAFVSRSAADHHAFFINQIKIFFHHG